MRTVNAARTHWATVCEKYGWEEVIPSDDSCRGGKLAAFVLYLADDTDLAYESISSYVWGLRAWMKLQRQVDPIFGVYDWQDFMMGVHVVTWSVGEPRRAVPISLLRRALGAISLSVFWEVQMGLFILLYLFSFSRSEHPCPKTYGGFDESQHASVCDVKVVSWRGQQCVALRLKVIKQDPRMERPEAAGNEDWVYIGDVDDELFSVFVWLQRVFAFHGQARDASAPFFVAPDRKRCLTYSVAMKQFRQLLARVSSVSESMRYGLHSLRVSGWNGARTGPDGEEIAVAHGGWHGGSQRRYDRFTGAAVLALPRVILAASDHVFDDSPQQPTEGRQPQRGEPSGTSAEAVSPTVADRGARQLPSSRGRQAHGGRGSGRGLGPRLFQVAGQSRRVSAADQDDLVGTTVSIPNSTWPGFEGDVGASSVSVLGYVAARSLYVVSVDDDNYLVKASVVRDAVGT